MLPLAAFALASAGAVGTNDAKESKAKGTMITAYIHDPSKPDCSSVSVDCVQGHGQACLSGTWTAFLHDTPSTCNIELRKP